MLYVLPNDAGTLYVSIPSRYVKPECGLSIEEPHQKCYCCCFFNLCLMHYFFCPFGANKYDKIFQLALIFDKMKTYTTPDFLGSVVPISSPNLYQNFPIIVDTNLLKVISCKS